MKRVLIADDEAPYRAFLRGLIRWERLGLAVSREAENGREALAALLSGDVDLAIVDVRMPVMDGLEFMEAAKKLRADVPIIALSSYDQYQLVRSSFRLGVDDYLLKTELTAEGLAYILRRTLRANVARALGGGPWLDTDLDGAFSEGPVGFVGLALAREGALAAPRSEAGLIAPDQSSRVALADSREAAAGALEAVRESSGFSAFYALDACAGGIVATLARLYGARGQEIADGRGEILRPREMGDQRLTPGPAERLAMYEKWLGSPALINGAAAGEVLVEPERAAAFRPEDVEKLYASLAALVSRIMGARSGGGLKPLAAGERFMAEYGARRRLCELNAALMDVVSSGQTGRENLYVARAVNEYINDRYMHNISLSGLARQLNVSAEHLSRTIAASMGTSFSQLLFDRRMERAKELMESGALRAMDISERVGYTSYENFSKAFKRAYGVAPITYMRMSKARREARV